MKGERLPECSPTTISLDESYAFCKSLAKRAARNFYVSFLALPADRFRAMCVLYAFMRLSDDLGDRIDVPGPQRSQDLTEWRQHLNEALQGARVDHPVYPALVDTVERYGIPHEYLFAAVDGVCMDVDFTGFETFEDLAGYCYHVAGAVGLCCIHIWGYHDSRAVDCAIDCGLAFQLTNILRDLSEDACMGRVYLPQEDLRRFGYTAEDIAAHCQDERFVDLMRFQVARAESYYRNAEDLFAYIDPVGKPMLRAMLRVYGGILEEIARRDYDVFSRRVTLPAWRKMIIAADALVRGRWAGTRQTAERGPDSTP